MGELVENIEEVDKFVQEGNVEAAVEIFIEVIEKYKLIDETTMNEAAFQLGWFLFEHNFYVESLEMWKKLQKVGYKRELISQIVEEAFVMPNEKEFKAVYEENLNRLKGQIHSDKVFGYEELPVCLLPAADNVYYLYWKSDRRIGEMIIADEEECIDDEIFAGEDAFSTVVFLKDWDYTEPIKMKKRNRKRMLFFVSDNALVFSYFQIPVLSESFQETWNIFDDLEKMIEFFHNHKDMPLPKLYKGTCDDARLFLEWFESEHKFRCSQDGRDSKNVLLTIGIPSYNRGQKALENIRHLQKLPYDSEVEFLVCDNCSQMDVEEYQAIAKLAESDSRITYYRFPDNPGDNPSHAETLKRASGKFCCLLSDEDLILLDNVWKYLYLIQKYGDVVGVICAAGSHYYNDNANVKYEKGEAAFKRIFWKLNYISGLIFRADTYQKLNLYDIYLWWLADGEGNIFRRTYPHNAAAMRCALETDIYMCGEQLFMEGRADRFLAANKEVNGNVTLEYVTVDSRLKQLQGLIELLNEWKDMLSLEVMKESYCHAVNKVFFLIEVARVAGKAIGCSCQEAYACVLRVSIKEIERLDIVLEDSEYAAIVLEICKIYERCSGFCEHGNM